MLKKIIAVGWRSSSFMIDIRPACEGEARSSLTLEGALSCMKLLDARLATGFA